MGTQPNPTVSQETMQAVFANLDARYATQEMVEKAINGGLAPIITGQEELMRQMLELRQAPGIISADTRERDKNLKEYSLSRLVAAKFYKHKTGLWPTAKEYSHEVAYLQKAIDTGTAGSGAELMPEEWANEVIENLRAQAVVLAAGVRVFPQSVVKMHHSSITAALTYQWLGEGAASTESTPTTGEVVTNLSTARGLSYFSLEFMREAGPSRDAAIRDEMVRGLQTFVDDAYLEGSGASRPTGLDAIAGINSIGADGDNANGGAINADDLERADDELDNDNAPTRRVWFMHPKKWHKIRRLKDANGDFLVGPITDGSPRVLLGYPVFVSTEKAVDETKGTGTNLSTALLVAVDDIIVAVGTGAQGIELAVSEEHRFANAQVAVRVLFRTDIKARHAVSICEISGIA